MIKNNYDNCDVTDFDTLFDPITGKVVWHSTAHRLEYMAIHSLA